MLKASFGSPGTDGSRASPAIFTQPRLMPPAAAEWMAWDALSGSGWWKKRADWAKLDDTKVGACANVAYEIEHGIHIFDRQYRSVVLDEEKSVS